MSVFCALWRRRLGGYLDGALAPLQRRAVRRHLTKCSACQDELEELTRLRYLIKAAAAASSSEPDWSTFWPAIRSRILKQENARRASGRRVWAPVFGHPRVALGSALAGMVLLAVVFWQGLSWWTGPHQAEAVTVHSVETGDPTSTVMVFTSPDKALTVVWIFGLDEGNTQ